MRSRTILAGRAILTPAAVLALAAVMLAAAAGAAAAPRARWTDTFNGTGNSGDSGYGIAVDRSSVYVTGSTSATGSWHDIWVRRYDRSHAVKWTDSVEGPAGYDDAGHAVALTPGGGVVVAGRISTLLPWYENPWDIWVREYAADGTVLWTDIVGDPVAFETARGVAVAPDGTIVVVGVTWVPYRPPMPLLVPTDIWVRAYHPCGKVRWTRTVNNPEGIAWGAAEAGVAVDRSGGIYVCGQIETTTGFDSWVRKYSPNGDVLWAISVPRGGVGSVTGIAVTPAGAATVVGTVGSDILVRSYTRRGGVRWTRRVNGPANGYDSGSGVALGGDGSVYVVGTVEVPNRGQDVWVRKYSRGGRRIWTRTYDGPDHGDDYGEGIAVAGDGSVYVIGTTSVAGGWSTDIWVRMYR